MIFLYTSLLVLLLAAHRLLKRRATTLEGKYVRVSRQADEVLRLTNQRPGNGGRVDPIESAKRQYKLALLATRRDRVERRYAAWQSRADRVAKLRARLTGWKGRKLPYTFGALDVVGVLAVIDYLGAGRYVGPRALFEAVMKLVGH
jgi:hypothetical protein